MGDPFAAKPSGFLNLPIELRLIIYKYLLIDDSTIITRPSSKDRYECEKPGEVSDTPEYQLSIRSLAPQFFSAAEHTQKLRSRVWIRDPFPPRTIPTTYHCNNAVELHTNILSVNRQIHEESAQILYSSYTFDFGADVESCIPFLKDLTPYSRSLVRHLKVIKKALVYEKDFDRSEWRHMCKYISTQLSLSALSLGIVSGRPYTGWDFIPSFTESDFDQLVGNYRREEMQWVRELLMIKGLKQLHVAPHVEHCPPPNSNAMAFFIAFSASIADGFTNFLSHEMLRMVQVA